MTPSVASAAHQIPIRFPEMADREPRGMVARSVAEVLGLGPKHLSRAELLELLRKAKAESGRDWLLFLVTFWHGLRASKAISLTPDNFVDGQLAVRRLQRSSSGWSGL